MPNGDSQFGMKCSVCGRKFYVESVSSRIPRHAPKEETEKTNADYSPCGGSGSRGIVAGTKAKRFEDL
jgi:hypothetical protein